MTTKILFGLNLKWNTQVNDSSPLPDITPEPLPVPDSGMKDITADWYAKINNPEVDYIEVDGLCKVDTIIHKLIENRVLHIKGKNNASILFGIPYFDLYGTVKQSGFLFLLGNNAVVIIEDVNICLAPQTIGINSYLPTIFASVPNHEFQWKAMVKNCDTTALGRNGGMGLGLLYGSRVGNEIAAVNFKHIGNGFIEAKANIGGSTDGILKIYLDNVFTDGTVTEVMNTYKVKVAGIFVDGLFTITSENTTKQIYNHFFNSDNGDNFAHILHVGRFTFMLDDNCDINTRQFRLRKNAKGAIRIVARKIWNQNLLKYQTKIYTVGYESHAGDEFTLNGQTYFCLEKGRDENDIWTNNFKVSESKISYHPYLLVDAVIESGEYDVLWASSFDLYNLDLPTWMLHKDSRFGFRSYLNTPFEYWEIMQGDGISHNMYNHRNITLWARNVVQKGFYRQTDKGGKCLGYTMINCEGFADEFNPPVPVSSVNQLPSDFFENFKY